MRWIAILFVMFVTTTTWAQERRVQVSSDLVQIAERYQEDGIYKISVFEIKPGKLQDLREHKIFPDRTSWNASWQRFDSWQGWDGESVPSAFPLVVTESSSALWTPKEAWSEKWEQKFYSWIDEEFDKDFFSKHEIATDCADAAIVLRWIFARIHSLPVGNHLAGSGVLFTQASMKRSWLRLPTAPKWHEDQRFLRVIDYVMNNTYTHSLQRDSYPMALNQKVLRAGGFLLELSDTTGHTRVIAETNYSDPAQLPVVLVSSTVPRAVRELYLEPFLGVMAPERGRRSLRHMHWVVKQGSSWVMPREQEGHYYSEEQYEDRFKESDFALSVYQYMNVDFKPQVIMQASINDVAGYIDQRVDVVEQGYQHCLTADCSPGTVSWENWSTPSRDKRVLEKFDAMFAVRRLLTRASDDGELNKYVDQELAKVRWSIEGRDFTLQQMYTLFDGRMISSDPRVSLVSRWGAAPQAAVENLSHYAKDLIQARSQRVPLDRTSCSSYCPVGSPEFQRQHTSKEDLALRKLLEAKVSYCSDFPKDLCEPFQLELNQVRVSVAGESLSLSSWLKRLPFLSSDPNDSPSKRWAQHQLPMHVVYEPSQPFMAVGGYRVDEQQQLIDIASETVVPGPEFAIIVANQENQRFPFIGFSGVGQKTVYAFSNLEGAWQKIDVSTQHQAERLALLGQGHLVKITGDGATGEVYKVDFSKMRVQPVAHVERPILGKSPRGSHAASFVIAQKEGRTLVFAPIEGEVRESQLSDAFHYQDFSQHRLVQDEYVIFSSLEKSVLVNLYNGQARDLTDYLLGANVPYVDSENGLIAVRSTQGAQYSVHRFSPATLEIGESLKSGVGHLSASVGSQSGRTYLVIYEFSRDGGSMVYRVRQGQLLPIQAPGDFTLGAALGDFSIWMNPRDLSSILINSLTQERQSLPDGYLYNFIETATPGRAPKLVAIEWEQSVASDYTMGFDIEKLMSQRPALEFVGVFFGMAMGAEASASVVYDRGYNYGLSRHLDIWVNE